MEFHETGLGKRFFESSVPALIRKIEKIGTELERLNDFRVEEAAKNELGYGVLLDELDEVSYHNTLFFSTICRLFPEQSYRVKVRDDSFVVGLSTPAGGLSFIFHIEAWDNFDGVTELDTINSVADHNSNNVSDKLGALVRHLLYGEE